MRIAILCGSLRHASSNREALEALALLAPPQVVVERVEGLDRLPHFNPDHDGEDAELPREVVRLRDAIAAADAVAISTPEYAHGLPGSFKNALDWLVSDVRFAGKPVAILHIARGTTWALDSLREILTTMSAEIVEAACVSLMLTTNRVDRDAILARDDLREALRRSLDALREHVSPTGSD